MYRRGIRPWWPVRALLAFVPLLAVLLTPTAASADYPSVVLADHPVSYWRMNDGSGTVAHDTQHVDDGSFQGGTTFSAEAPIEGGGSVIGPVTVSGAGSDGLQPAQWTLELWEKIQAPPTETTKLFRARAYGWELDMSPAGTLSVGLDVSNSQSYGVESPENVADANWHYIVVAYNGQNLSLYIDGRAANTTSAPGSTYYCCDNEDIIGADTDWGLRTFPGNLSEVALYKYALSASQIAAHYTAGGGTPCSSTSTAATLANFAAQICHFVTSETTIAQQQAALLSVAGNFPHVYGTGPNTFIYPAITQLSWFELIPTSAALALLNKANAEGEDLIKEILADKSGLTDLEEALPCTVKGIKGLQTAQEEDEKAVKDDLDGAQALADVLKGSSDGTPVSNVVGDINDGSKALVSKLTALSNALQQLSNECQSTGDTAFVAAVGQDENEVSADSATVTSAQSDTAMVATSGGLALAGTGVTGIAGNANVLIVTHRPDFSVNGALPASANPPGVTGSIYPAPASCGSLNLISGGVTTACGSGTTVTVQAGGSFAVNVAGLASGSKAVVAAGSTPVRLAVGTTNAEGSFSASVQIPADTEPGPHELYVLGTATDGSVQVQGIGITVTAPGTVATVPVENPPGKGLGPSIAVSAVAPPTITNLTQSHRRWREGPAGARIKGRQRKLPRGTTFSFAVNESASVSFAFTQSDFGRKVRGRCVAQSDKNRHGPACKRTITRGTLPFIGHAGINKVSFQGRLGGQKLKPGNYTLVITATNAAGHSSPQSLSFTIVK